MLIARVSKKIINLKFLIIIIITIIYLNKSYRLHYR